uniref:HECT-type E3 ubiquitin transferase n=1 Tax=Octactis speculum TaxID=3111310 RepID=A0A7S2B9D6_9STRA
MFKRVGPNESVLWFKEGVTWSDQEYMLIGTLLGLALYNSVLLDINFPAILYKKLLPSSQQRKYSLRDVASIDPELAQGLQKLIDYQPAEEVENVFSCFFQVAWTEFGTNRTVELIPNGSQVSVTGDNRSDYMEKYVAWVLDLSVAKQFCAFRKGFDRVMKDAAVIEMLRAEDLELLLTGTPELDFRALETVTSYAGGYHASHKTIIAFWKVVQRKFDAECQRKLLMFATGSIKAPIGGLGNLTFKVHKNGTGSMGHLPTSHTCFNTLLLPEYSSEEVLEHCLRLAISECEGFGLQ